MIMLRNTDDARGCTGSSASPHRAIGASALLPVFVRHSAHDGDTVVLPQVHDGFLCLPRQLAVESVSHLTYRTVKSQQIDLGEF
jgi:hypothetical protein